ncbi:MAG TPA: hypothetical protein VK981_12790, partial [Ramlibacter sp.]|nr:hypothetical protein [Ramlibacter sp.]
MAIKMTMRRMESDWIANQSCSRATDFCKVWRMLRGSAGAGAIAGSGVVCGLADKSDMILLSC